MPKWWPLEMHATILVHFSLPGVMFIRHVSPARCAWERFTGLGLNGYFMLRTVRMRRMRVLMIHLFMMNWKYLTLNDPSHSNQLNETKQSNCSRSGKTKMTNLPTDNRMKIRFSRLMHTDDYLIILYLILKRSARH